MIITVHHACSLIDTPTTSFTGRYVALQLGAAEHEVARLATVVTSVLASTIASAAAPTAATCEASARE